MFNVHLLDLWFCCHIILLFIS